MKIKRKYLKRTLIVLGIILGFIFTVILLFNLFFEEKVKSILLNKINEQLNTEITVEEIKIDLFHNFPYSSLSFHQVEMKDAIPDSVKGNLFEAENVYLQFSIFEELLPFLIHVGKLISNSVMNEPNALCDNE